MPHKEKVNEKLKLELITSYISGGIGRNEAARQAGVTPTSFMAWVVKYRAEGIDGLIPAKKDKFYPEQLKKMLWTSIFLEGIHNLQSVELKYVEVICVMASTCYDTGAIYVGNLYLHKSAGK